MGIQKFSNQSSKFICRTLAEQLGVQAEPRAVYEWPRPVVVDGARDARPATLDALEHNERLHDARAHVRVREALRRQRDGRVGRASHRPRAAAEGGGRCRRGGRRRHAEFAGGGTRDGGGRHLHRADARRDGRVEQHEPRGGALAREARRLVVAVVSQHVRPPAPRVPLVLPVPVRLPRPGARAAARTRLPAPFCGPLTPQRPYCQMSRVHRSAALYF